MSGGINTRIVVEHSKLRLPKFDCRFSTSSLCLSLCLSLFFHIYLTLKVTVLYMKKNCYIGTTENMKFETAVHFLILKQEKGTRKIRHSLKHRKYTYLFFLYFWRHCSFNHRKNLQWIINRIHILGTQSIKRNTNWILWILPWCQTIRGAGE